MQTLLSHELNIFNWVKIKFAYLSDHSFKISLLIETPMCVAKFLILKSFFLKFLADTCPFLGPLVLLFWIFGDVSSGFQSQSGFCLIRYFCGGECNVHSPWFTSGATLADLLAVGMQPVTSPHALQRWDLARIRTCNRTDRRRTRYHCASDPAFNSNIFNM